MALVSQEEQRLRAKKAKEDLEHFLLNNERMSSTIKYYRCHEMFQHLEVNATLVVHSHHLYHILPCCPSCMHHLIVIYMVLATL